MSENKVYGCDMSIEQWRDIPWATDYEASNYGQFRNKTKTITRNNGKPYTNKSRILQISKDGHIRFKINGKPQDFRAIDVIGDTFIPGYNKYLKVSYVDGNCNNVSLDNITMQIPNLDKVLNLVLLSTIEDTPVIAGGFGEGKRILFDITIAKKLNREAWDLRCNVIIPNLYRFEKGVHYLDLKEYSNFPDFVPMLLDLGYTEIGLINSDHIYIFSELGVSLLMSCIENTNDAKWEFLDKFTRKYFQMEEQIKNQQNTLEQQKKDLLFAIYTGGQAGIIASKQLTELEVQEATKPLMDTIEEQKPKVDKYEKLMEADGTYNATNAAKLLDIPTAQQFNKLLKDNKIQYKSGGNWVLYSKYQWLIDEGFAKYIEGENTNYSYIQLRWYSKGIEWIRDNILEDKTYKDNIT